MIYVVSAVFNDKPSTKQADEAFDNAYAMGVDIFISADGGISKGIAFIDDTFSFTGMLVVFAKIFNMMSCRSFGIVPEQDYMDEINPNPSKLLNIF